MPIVKSEHTTTNHRDGLGARFQYTFDDGAKTERGPRRGFADENEVIAKRTELEASVIRRKRQKDVRKIILKDGAIRDSGEATKAQVAMEYIDRAMGEEDPLIALIKLDKAQAFFTAEGWTPARIRARLEITTERWSEITTRLTYLKANEQTLIDYKAVLAGDS